MKHLLFDKINLIQELSLGLLAVTGALFPLLIRIAKHFQLHNRQKVKNKGVFLERFTTSAAIFYIIGILAAVYIVTSIMEFRSVSAPCPNCAQQNNTMTVPPP